MYIPFKTGFTVHRQPLDTPIHKVILFLLVAISPTGSALSAIACFPGSQELRDPMTYEQVSKLEARLIATDLEKCVNGQVYILQSYLDAKALHTKDRLDSRPVGPAYILHTGPKLPGPLLKVSFVNALGPSGEYDCHGKDVKVCTNLHTHGLHVSPKDNSDNVLLTLKPTETQEYEFRIPKDHPPGTHWMHAHLHGSTAPQLQNGMAGALILKGETDRWLSADYGIQGKKDKIMMLQQLVNNAGSKMCGKDENGKDRTTSINGQCLPTITVREGEVQHWRLIHAGISSSIAFTVETAHQTQIENIGFLEYARDGINLGRAIPTNMVMLQPGYRSDILVEFPSMATVCPGQNSCELHVVDAPTAAAQSFSGFDEPANVIATVMLESSKNAPMKLPPADDPHFAKPYSEIKDSELLPDEKQIYFAVEPDPNNSGKFIDTVNGDVYPNGATVQLRLNTAQTWRLWVGEKQGGPANHPFHIHVNPFEVIIRDKEGNIVDRYWKDTLLVSANTNKGQANALEIRSRYETFDGEFVLHCHNLFHEDAGMIKRVIISPNP